MSVMPFGSNAVSLEDSCGCDEIFAAIGFSVVVFGVVVVVVPPDADVVVVVGLAVLVVVVELGEDGAVVVCGLPCVCTVVADVGGLVAGVFDAASGAVASEAAAVTPAAYIRMRIALPPTSGGASVVPRKNQANSRKTVRDGRAIVSRS